MNAIQTVMDAVYKADTSKLTRRTIALAYLQLHIDNPGLHPDNWLVPDGGYGGWHVLVVHLFKNICGPAPDCVKYPAHKQFIWVLERLKGFHNDDSDNDLLERVARLSEFLVSMYPQDVPQVKEDMLALSMFHHDGPDDVVSAIFEFWQVLNFLSSLP